MSSNTPSVKQNPFEVFSIIAVLVFLLSYSYAMFQAPYIGFQYSGVGGTVVDIFVDQNQSPRLEKEDALVSFNHVSFDNFQSEPGLNLLSGIKAGDRVEMVVENEAGRKQILWTIPGFNPAEFLSRFLNIWLLSYVFWLAGTLTVLLVRPKDEKRTFLAAFFFITAIWLMAGSLSGTHLLASPYILRGGVWMSLPVYLQLHWNFPRPLKHSSSRLWLAFYFIAALGTGLQVVGALPSGTYILPFGLAILGSAGMLVFRFLTRKEERREIGLLFLAVLVSLVPALIIAVLSTGEQISVFTPGYLFSLLTLPGAYFYVVYRRQLGGAELRANRLISTYLFLILLLLLLAVLLPLFSQQLQSFESVGAALLLTAIVTATISVFGFARFQQFVERRLLRISQAPEALVRDFASRISTSFTQENLVEILKKEVLPSFLIRQSVLLRKNGGQITVIYGQGLGQPELGMITAHLQTQEMKPVGSQAPEILDRTGLRIVFPLVVVKEVVGFWLLGRKDPDDYYSYAERDLLGSLADQMAIALVNIDQAKNLMALYQVDIDRQEKERVHLARELHDDILPAVNDLSQASQTQEPDNKPNLKDRIRSLIHGLRPPMLAYGLYQALNGLMDDLAEKYQRVHFEFTLEPNETRFDPEVETYIYRILQQACENALVHGRPSVLRLTGTIANTGVNISVSDDGAGFSPPGTELSGLLAARHFGLAGMKERAALIDAQLKIDSAPGRGTQVSLSWKPRPNNVAI